MKLSINTENVRFYLATMPVVGTQLLITNEDLNSTAGFTPATEATAHDAINDGMRVVISAGEYVRAMRAVS